MGGGDLIRARVYAERVAQSNAEEVTVAAELVRRMNAAAAAQPLAPDSAASGVVAPAS